jgi:hypothetical protein
MKKVKVILTAITVFAVVGGALAFKAQNVYGAKIYTSTGPGTCPNEVLNFTTTSEVIGEKTYVSTVKDGECIFTYTKSQF